MTIELSRVLNDNPTLSQTDINYGYELRPYDDRVETVKYITSDSVNRHLRADPIGIVAREELYKIPEKFAPYAQMMVDYHIEEAGEDAYEDHNICGLYCDLTPTSTEATIGRAKYFDLLATLYSFPCIYRNEKHNIEFSGSRYIYNEYGVVYPMSLHRGVNPIGANTIAITSDNKIMVYKQDDDATTNPGRLMPSGSGVASWHDYADTGVTTLQELGLRQCRRRGRV